MTNQDAATTWLVTHSATTGPRHVVYAIGHAGSGATTWTRIAQLLPDDVELRAIRLPGREKRFHEPPAHSVEEQVDDLAGKLSHRATTEATPYTLVGVCSGAITAYELCRRLQISTAPAAGLVVACQVAPSLLARDSQPAVHSLPSPQLRTLLAEQGSIPPFIAESEDMFEVFEPFLRADSEAVESYVHRPEPLLDCPVVALFARGDDLLDRRDVLTWSATTRGAFSSVECGGGHNMLISDPAELATGLITALDVISGEVSPS